MDVLDAQSDSLSAVFVEYLDGARQYLESDVDKDPQLLLDVRLHFTQFIKHLIRSMPGTRCVVSTVWILIIR